MRKNVRQTFHALPKSARLRFSVKASEVKNLIDSKTPFGCDLSAKYKRSFAYVCNKIKDPAILQSLIDDLLKDKNNIEKTYGEKALDDVKMIIEDVKKLNCDMMNDAKLELLPGEDPDTKMWNDFLQNLPSDANSFYQATWLYTQSYFYRRLWSIFQKSKCLKDYDYFHQPKSTSMKQSEENINDIVKATRKTDKNMKDFADVLRIPLWANQMDLAFSAGGKELSHSKIFEKIEKLDANILVDNTCRIWETLNTKDSGNNIVHIICDNASFEVFNDFILAEYLIDHGLAKKIRFSIKCIPWFVSDTMIKDVYNVLKFLISSEVAEVRDTGCKLFEYFRSKKFVIAPKELFWTSPFEYYRMKSLRPDLYKYLAESHLILFKGDFNYRKLLGERNWKYTEPFEKCLRGFGPTTLCSLRTIKCELVCGLKPEQCEKLFASDPGWMITGNYAVIEFAPKNTEC